MFPVLLGLGDNFVSGYGWPYNCYWGCMVFDANTSSCKRTRSGIRMV